MTCPLASADHTCDAACVERERVFRRRPYRVVHAYFPHWRQFQARVEREIEHDPTFESPQFIGVPTCVEIPQVLLDDWRRVASALELEGFGSVGKVISFLAILGARTLCEQADRAVRG